MTRPLHIVLGCASELVPRVRYVFDSLFLARGIPVLYSVEPPAEGPWVMYGGHASSRDAMRRCLYLSHSPAAWSAESSGFARAAESFYGLPLVLTDEPLDRDADLPGIRFDIIANAFYFLSSAWERSKPPEAGGRALYSESVFHRLGIPQDVVDRYLQRVVADLDSLCEQLSVRAWTSRRWPNDTGYSVLLSHDVDFVPSGTRDILKQGAKTILRHLIRQRSPLDAMRAGAGLVRALAGGRDPYGCLPEIIAGETALGVRASFQIAVGHRHPLDVNYHVENDRTRDYLRLIPDSQFEVCLHGSYRSTEDPRWYAEEVEILGKRLAAPRGSRQHFLSFDYDALFRVQEQTGIQYDMSMGFPDRSGPRAGFSYPYFPWCLAEDRPYDVVEVSLFLMDATLRGYMNLDAGEAWGVIESELAALRNKAGCVSVVWHPIVFGGARDPGYEQLFWQLVKYVQETDGLPTDGRTINRFWRDQASSYSSFAHLDHTA